MVIVVNHLQEKLQKLDLSKDLREEQLEIIIASLLYNNQALINKAEIIYYISITVKRFSQKICTDMINYLNSEENNTVGCLVFFILYFSHVTNYASERIIINAAIMSNLIIERLLQLLLHDNENIKLKTLTCFNQILQCTHNFIHDDEINKFILVSN